MKIPKLQFPHISRLFSAPLFRSSVYWTGKVMIWSLLIGLFYYNITSVIFTQNKPSTYFLSVLQNPYSAQVHMQTAATLWEKGLQNEAKNELAIAGEITPSINTSVLGVTTTPDSLLSAWNTQPQKIQNDFLFWQTLTRTKPDYRDAFVQAANLAYQLGNVDEAKIFLQQSHDLDPNYQYGITFLTAIKH